MRNLGLDPDLMGSQIFERPTESQEIKRKPINLQTESTSNDVDEQRSTSNKTFLKPANITLQNRSSGNIPPQRYNQSPSLWESGGSEAPKQNQSTEDLDFDKNLEKNSISDPFIEDQIESSEVSEISGSSSESILQSEQSLNFSEILNTQDQSAPSNQLTMDQFETNNSARVEISGQNNPTKNESDQDKNSDVPEKPTPYEQTGESTDKTLADHANGEIELNFEEIPLEKSDFSQESGKDQDIRNSEPLIQNSGEFNQTKSPKNQVSDAENSMDHSSAESIEEVSPVVYVKIKNSAMLMLVPTDLKLQKQIIDGVEYIPIITQIPQISNTHIQQLEVFSSEDEVKPQKLIDSGSSDNSETATEPSQKPTESLQELGNLLIQKKKLDEEIKKARAKGDTETVDNLRKIRRKLRKQISTFRDS